MANETLTIRVRYEPAHVVVAVYGEINIMTAGQLRERLFPLVGSERPVVAVLDRGGLVGTTGLGVLVGAARRAAAHGSKLRVVCAQPQILRLIQETGLARRIPLARTVAEATSDQTSVADTNAEPKTSNA